MATLLDAFNEHPLPDPTFQPSPRGAREAPPETLAYVALINRVVRLLLLSVSAR